MIFWETLWTAARSREPMKTVTGSFMYPLASLRKFSGQVALVITVCLSGLMSSRVFLICGSNPMSSILSTTQKSVIIIVIELNKIRDEL